VATLARKFDQALVAGDIVGYAANQRVIGRLQLEWRRSRQSRQGAAGSSGRRI
jgi:hypothetical protein